MVLNVFDALKKIMCPDCKVVCNQICLKRPTLLRVQKLIHTILISDKNRIKNTLRHINFEKVIEEMKKEPEKHKMLLLSLVTAIIDNKVGVDKK